MLADVVLALTCAQLSSHRYLKDEQRTATFEKPKTDPTAWNPPSTTTLSPHLKFGALSARLFYYRLQGVTDTWASSSGKAPSRCPFPSRCS